MTTIINADNGVVSGVSGLKYSADSSGVLALQTNSTTALTITTAQIVGIGTTSPSATNRLTVSGANSTVALFLGNNANNYISISDNNGANSATFGSIAGGNAYMYSGGYASFYAGASEQMRITSAGNMGIGTSSPNAKLEVYNGRLRINAASDPGLELANTSAVKGYLFYDTSGADVVTLRHATSTTGINISSTGNVGIGTTTPVTKLVVQGVRANVDAQSGGHLLVTDTAAYNTSPAAGIQFGVQYNSAGNYAVGCSVQGYKENAIDGNFAQALAFTTQANGLSPAVSMRIDGVGRVTTPSQTAFRAYAITSVNYTTSGTKIQVHNDTYYNVGNNYSTGTFRFTAPVAGIYMFVARCWAAQGNTSGAGIQFIQNGAGIATVRIDSSTADYSTLQVVATTSMAANDYIELFTESCSASGVVHTSSGGSNSMFAGYLLG